MLLRYKNPCKNYVMGKENEERLVEDYTHKKDLGVIIQSDLQFSMHIAEKVKKANTILGLIKMNFTYIDEDMFRCLYTALIRHHLEYATCVWSPHKSGERKLIEGVQRKATKLIPSISEQPYNYRLRHQDVPTLEFGRHRHQTDMVQVYKLLSGLEDRNMSTFFTPNSTDLRGHSKKLFKCRNWLQLRRNRFSQRVIDKWNQLPEQIASINTFQYRFNIKRQLVLHQSH